MRALFLDRDGIVNEVVMRNGSPASPRSLSELKLIPEAIELAREAKKLQFLIVLITNQPDIARNLMTRYELNEIHEEIAKKISFDQIEVCMSANDTHFRRKPNQGMLLQSAKKLNISLADSFFLGDSLKDLQAGKRAGVTTILLQTDYNRFIHGMGDFNCDCFEEILKIIKEV
jgi:D-glycero-D-manno-heptose 1,7-bisphosphate phosphatase